MCIAVLKNMRDDIQLLRGLSVLAVILFHLSPSIFHNGYLGVDIFFVISGYVVTPKLIAIFNASSKKEIKKNLINFYKIRYYRLAPALAIVLIFFSLVMLLIGPLQEQRYSTAQGISALVLSANLYAARVSADNYFQPNPNSFLHTWSLSVEEQIYLIIPLAMLCLYPIIKKVKYLFIIITIFAYSIYFILLSNFDFFSIEASSGALYYSLIFRIWEFGLGGCLIFMKNSSFRINHKTLFLALFILIVLLPVPSPYLYPETACFLTLLYINSRFEFNESKSCTKIFIWLGNRSYSLYLVHLPISFILGHTQMLIGVSKLLVNIFSLITTFVIGNFCWKGFEQRYRITKDKVPRLKAKKSILLFTFLPLVVLVIFRVFAVNYYFLASEPEIQGTISCPTKIDGYCSNNVVDSERTVLLIGDSHAASISRTFSNLMSNSNIKGVVISGRGCQVYKRIKDLEKGGCLDYRIKVIDYLKAHPGTEVLLFQRSSSIEFNKTKDDTLYLQGVIEGLQEIQIFASKVYVLGPNPEFPSGFSQGTFLGLFNEQGYFPKNKMIQNSFLDGDYLRKILKNKDIIYLDSTNTFCSKSKCIYKQEDKFLFWDENHLSLDGAEFMRSSIARILDV